jgi:hypothetical protein
MLWVTEGNDIDEPHFDFVKARIAIGSMLAAAGPNPSRLAKCGDGLG